jgi:hypothetical protein
LLVFGQETNLTTTQLRGEEEKIYLVQEQLCGFLLDEVINPTEEFFRHG